MRDFFNIRPTLHKLAERAEQKAAGAFAVADDTARYNTQKVMAAFARANLSESHFAPSTGYGYGDRGREVLEEIFADITGSESALVRHNFVSGTHALTVALFGILRPGDRMVCISGTPYDTLHGVIGLGETAAKSDFGSLTDFGIKYEQLDLTADRRLDFGKIPDAVKGAKIAYIQRSRGYTLRPSISVEEIKKAVGIIKATDPEIIVFVDNCYGEFVEKAEPTEVGADLIVGSLIKNPGAGIARTGGYIAGRRDLTEKAAHRLTAPGVGGEVGATLGMTREMLMGLFFAPTVVASALKTAIFAGALFEELGFEVSPGVLDKRTDIIQSVIMGDREHLVEFCRGIQRGAPVDSFVVPEPWPMPGYEEDVIMAAGSFTLGSSIELSADAPLREPYAAFLQGGLTYESGRLGVLLAADNMAQKNLIDLGE